MKKFIHPLIFLLLLYSVCSAVTKEEYKGIHKYLDSLELNPSPENISKIGKLLYYDSTSLGLKYRILVDLANIGTRTAIETITAFENHLSEIPPGWPSLGRNNNAIYHHGKGYIIKPLITDHYNNAQWSFFITYDSFFLRSLWLLRAIDGVTYSQPVFLKPLEYEDSSIPMHSLDDNRYKLEFINDTIKFTSRWGFFYLHKKVYEHDTRELFADVNRDSIYDRNEKLLFLNNNSSDADSDGVINGLDKNPFNPNNTASDRISEIKKAVFAFYFGTTGSKDILITDEKINYNTYSGFIIKDNSNKLYGMYGYTSFSFGKIELINDYNAKVYLHDYEDPLSAATHIFKLTFKDGRWVVVDFKQGAIS